MKGNNKLYNITKAAQILGISKQAFSKRLKSNPPPGYLKIISGRKWIDKNHKSFIALMAKKEKEAQINNDESLVAMGLEDLREESIRAELEIPIQKSRLNLYKIEQERIQLEKDAKRLIEIELSDYLYTGYLDRMHREILSIPKRISKNIKMAIQGGIHGKQTPEAITKKIIKLLTREHEAVLKNVCDDQKREFESWKNE